MRTAGLGSGAVTAWIYSVLAEQYGLPLMPTEVAVILGGSLLAFLEWLGKRFDQPAE